jgi:hypothetical protein
MDAKEIQQAIFQQIKSRLAPNLVLVDTVAELLNISTDSAYRRIRGEKPISLDEVQLLCSSFGISLDTLLQIKSGAFLFAGKNVDERNFRFDEYLDDIIQQLGYFHSFRRKKKCTGIVKIFRFFIITSIVKLPPSNIISG